MMTAMLSVSIIRQDLRLLLDVRCQCIHYQKKQICLDSILGACFIEFAGVQPSHQFIFQSPLQIFNAEQT